MRAAADAKAAQARAFEEQRQRADQLAGNLALTQREVELLKAEAVRRREAAETSLAQAKRALDEERQKVGLLEQDLAVAHQSIDALEASAKVAATGQATATQRRHAAEAALMRAGEALALERNRTESLTHELDTARLEHDAAKDDVVRVSTAIARRWSKSATGPTASHANSLRLVTRSISSRHRRRATPKVQIDGQQHLCLCALDQPVNRGRRKFAKWRSANHRCPIA